MGAQVNRLCISLLVLVLSSGVTAAAKKPKLTPEEVIQRHLESLGPAASIAARKSLKAEGQVLFEVIVGGSGQLQGPSTFICDGKKLRMSMVFDISEYPGEDVAYNGEGRVEVGWIQPGVRSAMGQFFYQFDEIVTEGLFGGAMSTGWALVNLESLQPKLKYEGLKKVDGNPYHTIKYQRCEGGDVQTRLYFEPETFRHTHTIYKVRIRSPRVPQQSSAPGIVANNPDPSARQPETWYTVKESFANFVDIRGIHLPTRWTIEYSKEIGRTGSVLRFTTQYQDMYPNAEIKAAEFKIH